MYRLTRCSSLTLELKREQDILNNRWKDITPSKISTAIAEYFKSSQWFTNATIQFSSSDWDTSADVL
jgi:hypothetical protein